MCFADADDDVDNVAELSIFSQCFVLHLSMHRIENCYERVYRVSYTIVRGHSKGTLISAGYVSLSLMVNLLLVAVYCRPLEVVRTLARVNADDQREKFM